MAETTGISWTDSTFNPWIGCTKVSPGCDHCYAERDFALRRKRVVWGAGQERSRTKTWGDPVKWNAAHAEFFAEHGRRRRVFCASLADVFDNEAPAEWRAGLFALIASTPNLDWLLLTKRIGNVAKMIEAPGMQKCGLPPNVWLGATVVNQEEADRDIPKLLAAPARVRFLSIEPMLEPVDLSRWLDRCDHGSRPGPGGVGGVSCAECGGSGNGCTRLHWVICGGESGLQARPFDVQWARSIVSQCRDSGVKVFIKQLGAQPRGWCASRVHCSPPEDAEDLRDHYCDNYEASEQRDPCPGRCMMFADRSGGDLAEWPEDLRVQEFP